MELVPRIKTQERICKEITWRKRYCYIKLYVGETEKPSEMSTKLLEIPNYSIEVEKSLSKRIVATYIHKDVKYKRRFDLELESLRTQ